MTYAEQITDGILRVVAAFQGATQLPETNVSRLGSNDRPFLAQIRGGRLPRVTTVDTFLARMSALWPDDLDWPSGVPRPDPADDVSVEARAIVAGALAKTRTLRAAAATESK